MTNSGFVGLVVAIDSNRGIGKQNSLPWHLKGDMKFFKDLTIGQGKNAVIMGRKTWESIPPKFKPLADRLNIVLSRQVQSVPDRDNLKFMTSLPEALQYCRENAIENTFVIGGSAIYQEALAIGACDYLFVTKIKSKFDCDTFFPDYQEGQLYKPVDDEKKDLLISWAKPYQRSESGIDYEFTALQSAHC